MQQETSQRVVGQTKAAGFQIGVRRTFAVAPQHAWNVLTSDDGIRLWLGAVVDFALAPGATYRTDKGIVGEVRVVKLGSHFRLTWQLEGWARASTLQIRIISSNGKTVISFHQEHLHDEQVRIQMQHHWDKVLTQVGTLLGS